jgi:hypothetical protein
VKLDPPLSDDEINLVIILALLAFALGYIVGKVMWS